MDAYRIAADLSWDLCPIEQAPEAVRGVAPQLIKLMRTLEVPCCIAGGALRDPVAEFEGYKDIDVFFFKSGDQEIAQKKLLELEGTRKVYGDPSSPEDAQVMRTQEWGLVDLTRVLRGTTPIEIINTFDFVACCAAITPDAFFYHAEFERDAYARVLRVQSELSLNARTRERVRRFTARGWRINPKEIAKLPPEPPRPSPVYWGS